MLVERALDDRLDGVAVRGVALGAQQVAHRLLYGAVDHVVLAVLELAPVDIVQLERVIVGAHQPRPGLLGQFADRIALPAFEPRRPEIDFDPLQGRRMNASAEPVAAFQQQHLLAAPPERARAG